MENLSKELSKGTLFFRVEDDKLERLEVEGSMAYLIGVVGMLLRRLTTDLDTKYTFACISLLLAAFAAIGKDEGASAELHDGAMELSKMAHILAEEQEENNG